MNFIYHYNVNVFCPDMNTDDDKEKDDEADTYLEEEENEEKWRRKRFEREEYLAEVNTE